MITGKRAKGMGGAMDLVGENRVLVIMEHTAPNGTPKLLQHCTLPLTGKSVVKRVITDVTVMDLTPEGFVVRELAPEVTGRKHSLTIERAKELRRRLGTGENRSPLAREFGVDRTTVYRFAKS